MKLVRVVARREATYGGSPRSDCGRRNGFVRGVFRWRVAGNEMGEAVEWSEGKLLR